MTDIPIGPIVDLLGKYGVGGVVLVYFIWQNIQRSRADGKEKAFMHRRIADLEAKTESLNQYIRTDLAHSSRQANRTMEACTNALQNVARVLAEVLREQQFRNQSSELDQIAGGVRVQASAINDTPSPRGMGGGQDT